MGNFENLNKAITDLEKYYEVQSLNDYYLRAISGESSNTEGDSLPPSEMIVFNDILSTEDGGWYIHEILERSLSVEGRTEDFDLSKIFRILHFSGAAAGSDISLAESIDSSGMGNSTTDPVAPSKDKPSAAIIQVLPAAYNFSTRDTGAIQIFMNTIPTLEWSRCVPYFDLQVISGTPPVDESGKIGGGISGIRFLNGRSVVSNGSADYSLQAGAVPGSSPPPAGEETEPPPLGPTIAGMELFTSPQTLVPASETYREISEILETLVNANENPEESGYPGTVGSPRQNPVLDRMRPFMTVESFNIKVVPTRGMMSHKSAEMDLVLHDRSRLSEISQFVKPDQHGAVELLVEYGWAHPDAKSGRNPYGLFLNSLRCKEKYGVTNSKYKFTDDGQVSISLNLVTRGVDQVNVANVGMGLGTETSLGKALEAIIDLVSRAVDSAGSSGNDYSDVIGYSQISNISPTNAGELIQDEEVLGFINAFRRGDNPALAQVAAALNTVKMTVGATNTTLSSLISTKLGKAKNGQKPFMFPGGSAVHNTALGVANSSSWVSFGKLFYVFVIEPLMATGQFDEVHGVFYCFNEKSSFMYNQNLASFPMKSDTFEQLFKKYSEEKVQVSVGSFLAFINQYFLSNMASSAYGFSSLYTRGETGSAELSGAADSAGSAKDRQLRVAYGPDREVRFRLPRIRVIPEAVPHVSPTGSEDGAPNKTGTILRLHVVDDQADKYSSITDLIRASSNTGINAIRSTVEAAEGSTDANHESLKADIYQKASEYGLFKDLGNGYASIAGGPGALKHFIKKNMPYIEPGVANSAVSDFGMSSMHNSADATVHMIRAMREAAENPDQPGNVDRGLPMRVAPIQGQLKCMGCPILNHGQRFFIDLKTGTTADNIYVISGLDHKISPGKFETTAKLIQVDALGEYESVATALDRAVVAIESIESESTESESG